MGRPADLSGRFTLISECDCRAHLGPARRRRPPPPPVGVGFPGALGTSIPWAACPPHKESGVLTTRIGRGRRRGAALLLCGSVLVAPLLLIHNEPDAGAASTPKKAPVPPIPPVRSTAKGARAISELAAEPGLGCPAGPASDRPLPAAPRHSGQWRRGQRRQAGRGNPLGVSLRGLNGRAVSDRAVSGAGHGGRRSSDHHDHDTTSHLRRSRAPTTIAAGQSTSWPL